MDQFNRLYQGLMQDVEGGWIKRIEDPVGHLEIFNYTKMTQNERHWNEYTMVARGLVLDPLKKRVVAYPFPKFFNYGEPEAPTIYYPITVTDKMDGSFGVAFWDEYQDMFRIITRGSFQSSAAIWAQTVLPQNMGKHYTYLFEIVGPQNWVVIKYERSELILLSVNERGDEFTREQICDWATHLGVNVVDEQKFDHIDEVVANAKELPRDKEGFVVRGSHGHRVKVKGPEYLKLHFFLSRITPKNVWRWMRNGDCKLDPSKIPDEFLPDFNVLQKIFQQKFDVVLGDIEELGSVAKHYTMKELGLILKSGTWPTGSAMTRFEKKFLFSSVDTRFVESVKKVSRQRRSVLDEFEPKGKHLVGYVPLNSMGD